MRNSLMALLVALLSAHQAHELNLCARIDKASGAPKDGAAIRFRVECRKGEASFGTAGDLAMIRAIRADVDTISEAIDAAHGGREPGRVAIVEPATIAKAASGCGQLPVLCGQLPALCGQPHNAGTRRSGK